MCRNAWTSCPPSSVSFAARQRMFTCARGVTRRPKYACWSCTDGVVQAAAPARLIPGGMLTEATVAHVLVNKYADHLPLYRQAQIYIRQGVNLDRSTLTDWVGRAAFELRPVFDALMADLKRSTKRL